jgi:predicted ATP-grasp superfamily ATP-dependent carboligase
MPPAVIVVGASARALAWSASRAGIAVHAADLFADADLRSCVAEAVAVAPARGARYPARLVAAVAGFPQAPVCYTGALENHPRVVDKLATLRPLAGNDGRRLALVREPARLARAVRAAGLGFPDTRPAAAGVPTDGSYLVKPRASAGGRGIEPWRGGPAPRTAHVWQRRVRGAAWGVAFAITAGRPRLYGASRALVGSGWCGAKPFAWCGAVDVPPAAIRAGLRRQFDALGAVLAKEFGLVGLVGADLVVDAAGRAHVIEVNPRPTASMELVERAGGGSLAVAHLAACGLAAAPPPTSGRSCRWAKAVLFQARDRDLVVDGGVAAALAALQARWTTADGDWPALADMPMPGSVVRAGGPLLTVFAAAPSARAALARLRRRAAAVRSAIGARSGLSPRAGARAAPRRRRP